MTTKTYTLRLRTQDEQKLLGALRSTGREGQNMARTLEQAGRRGSRGLRAVDTAARDLRGRLQSTASHLPIIGQSLGAIGPAGLAAAAGAGALFLGLQRGMSIAREAVRVFDDIAKRADTFNIATDSLQALRLAAIEEDVGIDRMQTGLTRLANGAAMAAAGTGELVTNLQRTHPELVRQIAASESMEETLRLVTDALREAETETERTQIAYAAFGRSGLDMARMLARAEDGIDGLIVRAREAGIVVDEHILRNAEVMENRLGVASEVIRVQMMTAFVDLAPVLVEAAEGFAAIARAVSSVVDSFRELQDQSTGGLEERRAEVQAELDAWLALDEQQIEERYRQFEARQRHLRDMALRRGTNVPREEMRDRDAIAAELAEIDRILEERGARRPGGSPAGAGGESDLRLEADRQRAALEREAAQIRGELGNVTGLLAQREARLAEHVAQGTLTREEADASLARYRQSLDAANDNTRRAAEITAAMQTPLEAYRARIAELNVLLEAGSITQAVHARAVAAARGEYERADPALRRAAEIREGMLTTEQQFAREQAEVNALVAAGVLTQEEATAYLEAFRERLESAAGATRDLRLEQEILDSVLSGQIKTWDDLGRVVLRVLADIIRQQAAASDGSAGFFEFIGNVVGAVISGGQAPGSGGASPGAGSKIASAASSSMSAAAFAAGTAKSSMSSAQSLGFSLAQPSPALNVSINNYAGADVQVAERRSSNGQRELQVMVNRSTSAALGDGEFDGVMGQRFGARAVPGKR